jgi:hypothetical protein
MQLLGEHAEVVRPIRTVWIAGQYGTPPYRHGDHYLVGIYQPAFASRCISKGVKIQRQIAIEK